MAGDIEVRRGSFADLPEILDLMRASYGAQDLLAEESFWRWKHQQNPFGPSPIILGWADGRIVGVRIFMRWRWRRGAESVSAVRAVDTVTHPDWRGRGIFTRLTLRLVEELRRDAEFVFNTPNDLSRPGYLKMGWRVAGRVPIWVRPLKPVRMLGCLASERRRASSDDVPAAAFAPMSELLERPELEGFLARLPDGDGRYRTDLSPGFLHWRYQMIPQLRAQFTYRALYRFEGDEGAALILRRRNRRGMAEVGLAEILVTPTPRGRRMARGLVRELAGGCGGDYLVGVAAAATCERAVLARSGFLPAHGFGPRLTVRPVDGDAAPAVPAATEIGSWRLSVGSVEIF